MNSNHTKWKKGLSKKNLQRIQELNPTSVSFDISCPKVECIVELNGIIGVGISICSTLDYFNINKGKNIAIGRAMKAINRRTSDDPVRSSWEEFPDSWSKRQIKRVLSNSKEEKSRFSILSNPVPEVQ